MTKHLLHILAKSKHYKPKNDHLQTSKTYTTQHKYMYITSHCTDEGSLGKKPVGNHVANTYM